MKKRKTWLLLLPAFLSWISCQEIASSASVLKPSAGNNTSNISLGTIENAKSRSYIQKFSQSWKVYAKASDIAKREKLKKALTDALQSMEYRRRSDITTNLNLDIVKRIKHAAGLLKEFRQMYSLSENVKKTLYEYNTAKQDLKSVIQDGNSVDLLKRFLVTHQMSKRTNIPSNKLLLTKPEYLRRTGRISLKALPVDESGKIGIEFSSVDSRTSSLARALKAYNAAQVIMNFIAKNKHNLKHESVHKIITEINKGIDRVADSLSASKRRSVFPKRTSNTTSNDTKPTDVVPLLSSKTPTKSALVKNETLSTSRFSVLRAVSSPTNVALSKIVNHVQATGKRNNSDLKVMESLVEGNDVNYTRNLDKTIDTKHSTFNGKSEREKNKTLDSRLAAIERKLNPFVELLKRFGSRKFINHLGTETRKINISSNSTTSKNTERKATKNTEVPLQKISTQNVSENSSKKKTDFKKLPSSNQPTFENISKASNFTKVPFNNKTHGGNAVAKDSGLIPRETLNEIFYDEELQQRQKFAVERLKEAKLARQKYEIAKHELAQKVKELYELANEYEKHETDDQILEVKKSSTHPTVDRTVKRSEDHPGIALTGLQHHATSSISSATPENTHKGFTMGSIDKAQHQVKPDEAKSTKVEKVYDLGLPADVKLDDLDVFQSGKTASAQKETLKVIAQAIQNDMKEITKDDLKAKNLLSSAKKPPDSKLNKVMVEMVNKTKEDSLPKDNITDSIDEYLTKALAEIMSNDADLDIKDLTKSRSSSKESSVETNRRIVEKAMKQHAVNPGVSLPMLNMKGNKIVPNKKNANVKSEKLPLNNKTKLENNLFDANKSYPHSNSSDMTLRMIGEKSSLIDPLDPNNKALLDKATHMEEQVAAAQEKMYAEDEMTDPPPPPTKMKVALAPTEPTIIKSPNPDTMGSFDVPKVDSEMMSRSYNGDPYGSIKEQTEQQPMPPAQMYPPPMQDEPSEEDDEDEDEEEERYRPLRRRHRHHFEPEEPDDRDDDEEDYDDDDARSDDRGDEKRKRTLPNYIRAVKNTTRSISDTYPSSSVAETSVFPVDIAELEDRKKSLIPGIAKKSSKTLSKSRPKKSTEVKSTKNH